MSEVDAELAAAAECAQATVRRVFGDLSAGDGSVASQIAAGEWGELLTDQQARDLAELLRAMTEKVRHTRAVAGGLSAETLHGSVAQHAAPSDTALPLNRKERFYTGTVLPMLVGSDGFAHLHRLLELSGLDVDIHPDLDGTQDFQFFTEYGFAESIHTPEDKAQWPSTVPADTPDVVIAGKDWILAIEAKMFHNPTADDLRQQMSRQAAVIAIWQAKNQTPESRIRHVLLLPSRLAQRVRLEDHDVITWEAVLDAYAVVGSRYWVNVLRAALQRHAELESRPITFGANAHGSMTGAEIVAAHGAGTAWFDAVGRGGGFTGRLFQGDLTSGAWRTVKYEFRSGGPANRNWFGLADFIEATSTSPGGLLPVGESDDHGGDDDDS